MTDQDRIKQLDETLRVLWRTSGFLSGLAQDLKSIAPDRAQSCRDFVESLEAEARQLSANKQELERKT